MADNQVPQDNNQKKDQNNPPATKSGSNLDALRARVVALGAEKASAPDIAGPPPVPTAQVPIKEVDDIEEAVKTDLGVATNDVKPVVTAATPDTVAPKEISPSLGELQDSMKDELENPVLTKDSSEALVETEDYEKMQSEPAAKDVPKKKASEGLSAITVMPTTPPAPKKSSVLQAPLARSNSPQTPKVERAADIRSHIETDVESGIDNTTSVSPDLHHVSTLEEKASEKLTTETGEMTAKALSRAQQHHTGKDTAAQQQFEGQIQTQLQKEFSTADIQSPVAAKGSVIEKASANSSSIVQPLRTYQADIATMTRSGDTTMASVIAKEVDTKKSGLLRIQKAKSGWVAAALFAVSGLLVIAGAGSLVYSVVIQQNRQLNPFAEVEIPSHIFVEEQEEVNLGGDDRRVILRTLTDKKNRAGGTLGSMTQFYLTTTSIGDDQLKRILTPSEFLGRINSRAPSTLIRALDDRMTFGVHIFDGNEPFLIFQIASYERSFAGMLEWEPFINEDLAPLFGPLFESPSLSPALRTTRFEDTIISNKEVRRVRDSSGKTVLMYSFIDSGTIVITTEEKTFEAILDRFTSRSL